MKRSRQGEPVWQSALFDLLRPVADIVLDYFGILRGSMVANKCRVAVTNTATMLNEDWVVFWGGSQLTFWHVATNHTWTQELGTQVEDVFASQKGCFVLGTGNWFNMYPWREPLPPPHADFRRMMWCDTEVQIFEKSVYERGNMVFETDSMMNNVWSYGPWLHIFLSGETHLLINYYSRQTRWHRLIRALFSEVVYVGDLCAASLVIVDMRGVWIKESARPSKKIADRARASLHRTPSDEVFVCSLSHGCERVNLCTFTLIPFWPASDYKPQMSNGRLFVHEKNAWRMVT